MGRRYGKARAGIFEWHRMQFQSGSNLAPRLDLEILGISGSPVAVNELTSLSVAAALAERALALTP